MGDKKWVALKNERNLLHSLEEDNRTNKSIKEKSNVKK
jgi:hypothetical protein